MTERRYHKLYAEYKVIQKSGIECSRSIVCIGCKRKCNAVFFFKFVGIVSQILYETNAKVEVS